MPTRNGKIANLPNDIREQLNFRLLEGETGRELAAWLNALPGVQSILSSHFNGSPISEVNLTHWRQGGYLQWLTERECFDSARALAERDCSLAGAGLSAEQLLNILTLRFGQLLMRWDFTSEESVSDDAAFLETARKARILQNISRSVLAIHRIQSQQRSSPSNWNQPNAGISIDRTEKSVRVKTEFDSSGDHSVVIAPESHASNTPNPSSESPHSSSPHRTPKLAPGLTIAPLAGANPKILSGPIAPPSVHPKLSPAPASTQVLNAA